MRTKRCDVCGEGSYRKFPGNLGGKTYLTGGQEGEKAYVVRDTECGSKKR
ncbi:MAG: hypothetical protein ACKO3K_17805 [Cuspidothrix sp.]